MNKMNRGIDRLSLVALALAGCMTGDARPNATPIAVKTPEKPPATAPAVPTAEATNTANPPTRTPETPKATTTPSVFEGKGGPILEMVKIEEQLWAYIKKDLEPKGIFNARVVAKETQDPNRPFLYVQYVDNRGQVQSQIASSWTDDGKLGGYTPQAPEIFAGLMPESLPVNFGNPDELSITFMGLKKVPGQDDLVPSYKIKRNNREVLSGNVWVPDAAPTVAASPTARATAVETATRTVATIVAPGTKEAPNMNMQFSKGVMMEKNAAGVIDKAIINGTEYAADYIDFPGMPKILLAYSEYTTSGLHGKPTFKNPDLAKNVVEAYAIAIASAKLKAQNVPITTESLKAATEAVKLAWKNGEQVTGAVFRTDTGDKPLGQNRLLIKFVRYQLNDPGLRGADGTFTADFDFEENAVGGAVVMTVRSADRGVTVRKNNTSLTIAGQTIEVFNSPELDQMNLELGLVQDLSNSFMFLAGYRPMEMFGISEEQLYGNQVLAMILQYIDPNKLAYRNRFRSSGYQVGINSAIKEGDVEKARWWLVDPNNPDSYSKMLRTYWDGAIWQIK